jgi:prepilin-type N-terminal cleavage/methylation domain-containing protein
VSRWRAGFTLLELLLVMAIILVAAALSIPAIDAIMADGRVKAARDVVRGRWADIRGRAMQEGRPYKFSVIYQTGKFRIEPEDQSVTSSTDDAALIVEDELPGNVLFAKDAGTVGAAGGGAGGYEPVAVYLPNGTARDDVQMLFGREGNQPLGLQLRALTGAVTMLDKLQDVRP